MPGPLYHNGPLITAFYAACRSAPQLVVMPKFDAEATLANIDGYRASWVYFVPTMMGRIWRLPEERARANTMCRSLQHDLASGGALPGLAQGRMDRMAGAGCGVGALWRHRRHFLDHDQRHANG